MFDFYDKKLNRLCFFIDIGEYYCYEVKPPRLFFRPWWELISPEGEVLKFPKRLSLFEISNILANQIERKFFSVFLPQSGEEECRFFVVSSPSKGIYLFFFKDKPLPQNVFSVVKVSDRPCLSKTCIKNELEDRFPCIERGLVRVW